MNSFNLSNQKLTTDSVLGPNCDLPLEEIMENIDKSNRKKIVFFDFSKRSLNNFKFFQSTKRFTLLHSLSLNDVGLIEIPKELSKIPKNLKFLDLSFNNIQSFPKKLKWISLEGLNLGQNKIETWPSILDSTTLPNLNTLIISFNPIFIFPDLILPFAKLQYLDISYCSLLNFPIIINKINTLRYLDISGNFNLKGFSLSIIENLTQLKYLNINNILIDKNENVQRLPSFIIAKNSNKNLFPLFNNSTIIL